MASIRFLSPGIDRTVRVDVMPGERRTLLSVAREHGIPLLFNCQSGDCGACMIHVETLGNGGQPCAPLAENESFLLRQMRLLTEPEIADAERRGVSPEVRLACVYQLRSEDIVVVFGSELGRT